MKKVIYLLVLLTIVCFFALPVNSGNIYRIPLNNFEIAFPWKINEINLYHFGGNSAWLEAADSLNWMTISINSQNSWGNLRRNWDAYGDHQNFVRFTGLKHVSATQTFYGVMQYNMDYLDRVNKAIEIEPYAADPFVPCDSVEGDFSYIGPKVNVAFSHQIFKKVWWGCGLDYQIYRGLKDVYSMPEIIRRKIKLDLSLAVQLTPAIMLGLSVKPYDILDIIKIVKQPDGTSPIIHRYRGEFLFTSSTSTEDRNARTRGMDIRPQLMLNFSRLKSIIYGGYEYQWFEVYDSPLVRKYDGYYYGKRYYFSTIWRYFFTNEFKSSITCKYHFSYLDDWAEEPVFKLMIYRSYQRFHDLALGLSKQFGSLHPLILALETNYQYLLPDKQDYLAKVFRKAAISNWSVKIGSAYSPYPRWFVYSAVWYNKYEEPAIWNYFGDYKGPGASLGISLSQNNLMWVVTSKFGIRKSVNESKSRRYLNIQLQLRKFL